MKDFVKTMLAVICGYFVLRIIGFLFLLFFLVGSLAGGKPTLPKNGVLDVALDYSSPTYRNSSEGRYLLEHLPQEGLKLLRYEHAEEGHVGYLKKMGYELKNGVWERKL